MTIEIIVYPSNGGVAWTGWGTGLPEIIRGESARTATEAGNSACELFAYEAEVQIRVCPSLNLSDAEGAAFRSAFEGNQQIGIVRMRSGYRAWARFGVGQPTVRVDLAVDNGYVLAHMLAEQVEELGLPLLPGALPVTQGRGVDDITFMWFESGLEQV